MKIKIKIFATLEGERPPWRLTNHQDRRGVFVFEILSCIQRAYACVCVLMFAFFRADFLLLKLLLLSPKTKKKGRRIIQAKETS